MTDKAPVTVEQGDRFLLVKRGLYYRPGNQGYTGIKDRAGRYPESDARPEDGITAIHEDEAPEYSQACFADLKEKHMLGKIAALEEEIKRLRLDLAAQECLQDSAYKAGVKHGWNLCVADDEDGYQHIANGTEHIAELKRIREARTALEGRGS
ncbi:hypothetical protein M527_06660 [Sphingobium indicum IP26]|uniref:Uncharacterized protein n=1 Tax=Sphingobium indicum F2 TaxID=1450518 RepID=A0A8E0WTP5_9SPHN|nr:hypothetical protein [Sphingobium indicum]EPR09804.1 hypothetical protein M527_06660 [Sphingobium indicum IP26]KER37248.1 hypothetical protein AL00_06125 [Sphingobium indicum F2]